MASTEQSKTYVDLLEEDKPIAGQKFVCVSFVSPENVLKQKNLYTFEEFLKYFDFSKSMEKMVQFINFISYKYKVNQDKVMADFEEFVKAEKDSLINTTIEDEYKNFLDKEEDRIEKEFAELNNFQTSTRGLKIRGSFPTQEEAELRARMLREVDPYHDVYVGPVGMWMPWEPEAYKTGRVEYLEDELNKLMHEKINNEEKAKQQFEARVKEARRAAIEENIKNAEESGAKLTQTIDEEGNLVSVANMNTTENSLVSNEVVSGADIRKELFEGDNIRTKEVMKQEQAQFTSSQTTDATDGTTPSDE